MNREEAKEYGVYIALAYCLFVFVSILFSFMVSLLVMSIIELIVDFSDGVFYLDEEQYGYLYRVITIIIFILFQPLVVFTSAFVVLEDEEKNSDENA